MSSPLRRVTQTHWVAIAMVVGIGVGYLFPDSRANRGDRSARVPERA